MTAQNGDVIEVAVIHDNTSSGDQINNYQLQVDVGGPISDSDLLDDISEIFETLYLLIKTAMDVRNVLREVVVRNKTQGTLVGSTLLGTYTQGSNATGALPQGVAAHIYFKTGIPRVVLAKYLPSFGTSTISIDGRVTTAVQTQVTTFAAALTAPLVAGANTYQYGHLSPKTLQFELPTVFVVGNVMAYQRRRKEGRGS